MKKTLKECLMIFVVSFVVLAGFMSLFLFVISVSFSLRDYDLVLVFSLINALLWLMLKWLKKKRRLDYGSF